MPGSDAPHVAVAAMHPGWVTPSSSHSRIALALGVGTPGEVDARLEKVTAAGHSEPPQRDTSERAEKGSPSSRRRRALRNRGMRRGAVSVGGGAMALQGAGEPSIVSAASIRSASAVVGANSRGPTLTDNRLG